MKYPWNESFRSRWQRLRKRGKFYFITVYGTMGFGLTMWCFNHVGSPPHAPFWSFANFVTLLVWLLMGTFYGLAIWLMSERRYKRGLD